MILSAKYIKSSDDKDENDKRTIVSDDNYMLAEAIIDLTKEINRLRHGR